MINEFYCQNCRWMAPTRLRCKTCKFCDICCGCKYMKLFKSKLEFHKPTKKQLKLNTSPRFISAEIEVAGIDGGGEKLETIIRDWKGSVVHDGSLPERGFEINTAPAAGDLFVAQIKAICKGLKDANARVSNRCGLHIHVDARDFGFPDIRRLVRAYTAIEPALFNMVPRVRRNSRFCAPCAHRYEKIVKAGKIPYAQVKNDTAICAYGEAETAAYKDHKYPDGFGGTITDRARYNALNLHSWFYRGTVEFRMFEGTIDAKQIINFGTMLAKVLDYVSYVDDENVVINTDKSKSVNSLLSIVDNKNLQGFIKARTKQFSQQRR